jgi:hypothetical protein
MFYLKIEPVLKLKRLAKDSAKTKEDSKQSFFINFYLRQKRIAAPFKKCKQLRAAFKWPS